MTEHFVLFMLLATLSAAHAHRQRWGATIWFALCAQFALVLMLLQRLEDAL